MVGTSRCEPGCVVAFMEGNNQTSDKTNSTNTVDEETLVPTTSDGQRIAVEQSIVSKSTEWEIKKDKRNQHYRPSYPACTSARTTFRSNKAENKEKYDVLFLIQHGRQHPAERRPNGYSEGWDGQKVRQEDVGTYCLAAVVLSQADVKGYWLRRIAKRVVRENLNGFSRHYDGTIGAAFGFAMLELRDDVAEAKDSYLAEVASEQYDLDSEKLAEYVFRKYGGDEQ